MSLLVLGFSYGLEYLGNGPRFVLLRLQTGHCDGTHLKMGCAPAGPAGTGFHISVLFELVIECKSINH